MKLLFINGSPHKDGCTAAALREVSRTLEELGIETETHWVGNKPVPGCIACGSCKKTGACIYDDGVNELLARSHEWDGLVVGSPGPSVLRCRGPTGRQGGCRCSFLPPGRGLNGVPAAQYVFRYEQHGGGHQPVLEPGAWQHASRGGPGSGGPANHAHPGPKPGLDSSLPSGCCHPGSRAGALDAHQLHPVK